ncbi:hypothetical protein RHMOL_Rhmol01G0377900 [Rhododendron molle]|uniref:Uncharacterized protein n=1 Tax=Rhododendron molle TaxID=49168 RepID=A0ACC0Q9Q4_RHOML|nr:hypothetical protein RHMOL_Rhmol01G0377900 [Rhododendron molle]
MVYFSSLRSGIGADMGSLSVSGIGYGIPHIRPKRPECHPYRVAKNYELKGLDGLRWSSIGFCSLLGNLERYDS